MSPRSAGSGLRWRRWTWAIDRPEARIRRHAAPIGPYVDPHPITATVASPVGSSTSVGGIEFAMPSILAWRVRTMKSWLAGS
jgi:hypothetical protein